MDSKLCDCFVFGVSFWCFVANLFAASLWLCWRPGSGAGSDLFQKICIINSEFFKVNVKNTLVKKFVCSSNADMVLVFFLNYNFK